jgi:hypothetical protein
MTDFLNTEPPDDTGTDTLQRYRYQAQLAVPFCLDCALGGAVHSVIMEHYEDIVVEYEDHWRFIQVKTRDSKYGPWRLTLAMDGLGSLYRAHERVSGLNARYSLFLEGAVAHADDLNNLVPEKPTVTDANLINRVAKGLQDQGFTEAHENCEAFLDLTSVQPNQPPREHITTHNASLLAAGNSNVSWDELKDIEQRITDEVLRAMSQERLEDLIPAYISNPDGLQEEPRRRVEDKRLTKERLTPLLGSLAGGAFPLLRRVVEPELGQPTNLERKLLAAGATRRIVDQAKNLRANASIRATEVAAADIFGGQDKVDDVHSRIEIRVTAIAAKHRQVASPAAVVWAEVMESIERVAEVVDPNWIYRRDPYLILGAACGLSDECLIDWGVPLA